MFGEIWYEVQPNFNIILWEIKFNMAAISKGQVDVVSYTKII